MNRNSFAFAFVLNLLMPGLGHGFWKEYAFGIFVFLVMVLSAVLGLVSFLLPLSGIVKGLMFGIPVLFYAFTFVDLKRVVLKCNSAGKSFRVTAAFLAAGILWQVLSPLAPVNFAARNAPSVIHVSDNALSPVFRDGDWLWSNSLEYRANLFFVSRPQLYDLPKRGELVRFADSANVRLIGIVLGYPGEQIEISGRSLSANGVDFDLSEMFGAPLSGSEALTQVASGSILIATIRLGMIEKVHHVPVTDISGKVRKLL